MSSSSIQTEVKVWEENVEIPTYETGLPDKNPMFLEKRVYQGSSGRVYPHPVIDKIHDEKTMKKYRIVVLENEFVQIQIMPQLGGRIYRALDKTNNYDFVYYNRVIKPALVGLAGPWVSGGIEFNWPQHHRPNTYGPVECQIEANKDGSQTVWVGETDRMYGTKVTTGFTLHPGKAYLEIHAQLYNRTAEPQTFLWWANPAVAVNDHTQSVFPPDVHAVFDHGKRDVSKFPMATGTYYKMDYSAGVDISKYSNIPVPTSYMAYHSDYPFVGGYDHGVKAGILHFANKHVSPGKKQWTWGNGEFGQAWDRNLTDEDGPYIELMTGVYTDNQPDFSWLHPYEEKSFKQYFMPYKNIGMVKNASLNAAVNLEITETLELKGMQETSTANKRLAQIQVYATSRYEQANIILKGSNNTYGDWKVNLSPTETFEAAVWLPEGEREEELRLSVYDREGRELISYKPQPKEIKPLPEPAKAIEPPEGLPNTEALYLAGLHLEQYRHATYEPDVYYLEGLKRDPGDIRLNNAYGLLLLRRGQFEESETYFRKAAETLTRHNARPYDSEPFFNLGKSLKWQGRLEEAFTVFYKSVWSAVWQAAGYFHLAQIAAELGNSEEALELIERSLNMQYRNFKARHLKTMLLRKLGRLQEAEDLAIETIRMDPIEFGSRYERYRIAVIRSAGAQEAVQTEGTRTEKVQQEKVQTNHTKEHSMEQAKEDGNEQAKREAENKEEAADRAQEETGRELLTLLRGDAANYIGLAQDYAEAGQYAEALRVLDLYPLEENRHTQDSPLLRYYQAYYYERLGQTGKSETYYALAAAADPAYCFPNTLHDYQMLQHVTKHRAQDSRAFYYLGNLLYDKKRHDEAARCWEASTVLDGSFATPYRNLALAYYNKQNRPDQALTVLEQAFALNPADARVFYELDQLYKKLGSSPEIRLQRLEQHLELVKTRDDLYLEYITLENSLGNFDKALELILQRHFHPWEGGEGKVPAQYVFARVERAKRMLGEQKPELAVAELLAARQYPLNIGEGKLEGAQENDIHYYLGLAYEQLEQHDAAMTSFKLASEGLSEPASAMFYNDQPPHQIFYQGLAQRMLGNETGACSRFNKLVDYGEQHLFDDPKIDYFAVSLPDFLVFDEDLKRKNVIHCRYMMGLGYLGLNHSEKAAEQFETVLELEPHHQGAAVHLKMTGTQL